MLFILRKLLFSRFLRLTGRCPFATVLLNGGALLELIIEAILTLFRPQGSDPKESSEYSSGSEWRGILLVIVILSLIVLVAYMQS
jgi:hypothetical protein